MKKILIISLNYFPFIGGAEVAVMEITNRIKPDDIEFHMVCLALDRKLRREEKIGRVHVHRIKCFLPDPFNKAYFQIAAAIRARSLMRKYKFDAIWAMMAHTAGVPAALFKTLNPKVPYLLTLQEGDPPLEIQKTMRWFGPLFRRGFTKADFVQAISTYLGAWAREMKYAGPLEVIPNGVDAKRFAKEYDPFDLETLRGALGVMDGETALVTASRLVRKNAVDDVIRALVMLPKSVKFVICGTGPDEAALRALAEELEVGERVMFAGHIGHELLPKYLKACDIFIRPSRSEGMGNSFIEAMAAGIPVIGTREGGIADFLFDPRRHEGETPTGFSVDKDAPAQIADAVRHILAHPEEVKGITEHAKKIAAERYDWNLVAADMRERVFARLMK